MNWLVYHIAGGGSFFSGVALLLVAVALSTRKHWLFKRLAVLTFCVGIIAIAVSATPMPYWQLAIVTVVTIVWIASAWFQRYQGWTSAGFITVWLFAALWEAAYWIEPAIPPVASRHLTIIGDSVTAGMGEGNIETWPVTLAREHELRIQDQSGVGFKTGQSLRRAREQGVTAPLVIVEIGGNDLLGGRTSRQFKSDLEALLSFLADGNRTVIMFELPLMPFYADYGRVQRSLARKHGVLLVPKHVFLRIIAPEGATLDTIHLSQAGQEMMALEVWRLIGPALRDAPPISSP